MTDFGFKLFAYKFDIKTNKQTLKFHSISDVNKFHELNEQTNKQTNKTKTKQMFQTKIEINLQLRSCESISIFLV